MLGLVEAEGLSDGELLGLSEALGLWLALGLGLGDSLGLPEALGLTLALGLPLTEALGLILGETELLGLGVVDGLTQSSDIEFLATTVIISEALFTGFERKSRYTAVVTGSKCFTIDRCFSAGISNFNSLSVAAVP